MSSILNTLPIPLPLKGAAYFNALSLEGSRRVSIAGRVNMLIYTQTLNNDDEVIYGDRKNVSEGNSYVSHCI